MTTITGKLARLLFLWTGAASAQELSLPSNAVLTFEETRAISAYALPVAPWSADAGLPMREVEGPVVRQAYRLDGSGLTPLQLMAPLRSQLVSQGFEIVLDCADRACGGFDFRFTTEVLDPPAMYVDLSEYRFLSAFDGDAAVSILTSRDPSASFVQVIRVGQAAPVPRMTAPPPLGLTSPATPGSIGALLEADGFVVLDDVTFGSGSDQLGDGPIASLDALRDYLLANPGRQVLFVGHTDAVGSLEGNQALSLRRASAAMAYLAARGVPPGQIAAQGAGYLAPRASNLTADGRERNRRVEVVLLSTQ